MHGTVSLVICIDQHSPTIVGGRTQTAPHKTMNLFFMSVAGAVVISIIVWLFFKAILWTQGLEDKDIKGK